MDNIDDNYLKLRGWKAYLLTVKTSDEFGFFVQNELLNISFNDKDSTFALSKKEIEKESFVTEITEVEYNIVPRLIIEKVWDYENGRVAKW